MPSTRTRRRQALACGAALTLTAPLIAVSATTASADPALATYSVTIANSSGGQPFSPPVATTHSPDVDLFSVGEKASAEIAAIAQAGDQSHAVALLSGLMGSGVTAVADPGMPVTPGASSGLPFASTLSFEITAAAGDVLSVATMLICSNDGFTGLDSVALPDDGPVVLPLRGYDAGVERNTEKSQDIVDPCSALGPVVIGDADGNVDEFPVAQRNAKPIQMHKGVNGHRGDLLPAHDWDGSVGTITIEKV